MRVGKCVCINLGKALIKLNQFRSENFDPNIVFDFRRGREEENLPILVKEDEKYTDL